MEYRLVTAKGETELATVLKYGVGVIHWSRFRVSSGFRKGSKNTFKIYLDEWKCWAKYFICVWAFFNRDSKSVNYVFVYESHIVNNNTFYK